jgi:hypothetical protein
MIQVGLVAVGVATVVLPNEEDDDDEPREETEPQT